MRIKRNPIILTEWQIPNNPNGNLWKKNKSFRDSELLQIISEIEKNDKVGSYA